jgi:hypothetical protein
VSPGTRPWSCPPRSTAGAIATSWISTSASTPRRYYPWHGSARWLNLKLSTRTPCDKYRAANAWANCQINLNVRVFYPNFLA